MTAFFDAADMVRDARRGAGLSQEELARRAGVSRPTVARMETVARSDMSVSALARHALSEASGISKPYLSQIEGGKRDGTTDTMSRIARALQVPMDLLLP